MNWHDMSLSTMHSLESLRFVCHSVILYTMFGVWTNIISNAGDHNVCNPEEMFGVKVT